MNSWNAHFNKDGSCDFIYSYDWETSTKYHEWTMADGLKWLDIHEHNLPIVTEAIYKSDTFFVISSTLNKTKIYAVTDIEWQGILDLVKYKCTAK